MLRNRSWYPAFCRAGLFTAGNERRGGVFNRPVFLHGRQVFTLDARQRAGTERRKTVKDYKRTKEFRALRQSLLDNLHERGLDTQCYEDKVDEYMDFWVRRKELREDIETRGFTVTDDRGRVSENRSLSLEVQVSRQMLAIFTTLGFREDALRGGGGGDDEL